MDVIEQAKLIVARHDFATFVELVLDMQISQVVAEVANELHRKAELEAHDGVD